MKTLVQLAGYAREVVFKESVLSQSSCKERDIDDLIFVDEELRRIASLWPNKETDDW